MWIIQNNKPSFRFQNNRPFLINLSLGFAFGILGRRQINFVPWAQIEYVINQSRINSSISPPNVYGVVYLNDSSWPFKYKPPSKIFLFINSSISPPYYLFPIKSRSHYNAFSLSFWSRVSVSPPTKPIQFLIIYVCECFATNKSLFNFIMHFFSRRWLIRNPSIIKGRKMFVKHAVDSAFSEETSVMSLHGELRNIIFDDSPLPVIHLICLTWWLTSLKTGSFWSQQKPQKLITNPIARINFVFRLYWS